MHDERINSVGFVASLNVAAFASQVTRLSVFNKSGSTIYLMMFDKKTAPAASDVPDYAPIPIPAGGLYESTRPRFFGTGCWLAGSSTAASLTASGADLYIDGDLA